MKISELIAELQQFQEKYGDLPVVFNTYFGNNPDANINVYIPDENDPHDVDEVKHVWIEV